MVLAQFVTDSGVYKFLVVLHILTAIIGFGAVFFNGTYGSQSKARPGPEGLAITQANLVVSRIAEYFIYAVFVFGVLMVFLSPDDRYQFEDMFVWLSIVLYLLGIGISHGLLWPNVRRMAALATELVAMGPPPTQPPPPGTAQPAPPPQVMEIERHARIVGMADVALKIILVAILCLMVWKPL
ncbi:MAG: hypothetical protein ACRDWD_01520 [Acidimicrobiia bacterium]